MEKFKTPLQYGLIGALVGCILGFVTYLFYRQIYGSMTMQMLFGFVTLAVWIFVPIWSGVTFKRERSGVLSFGDAFLAVFITFFISNIGSSLTNYIIPNVIDKDYSEKLMEQVKSNTEQSIWEKFGSSQEQIDKATEGMTLEKFQPSVLKTLKYFGIGLLVSAFISLIIAAFLRRNPGNIAIVEANAETPTQ